MAAFALRSPAFEDGSPIPRRTCEGEDVSPALKWTAPLAEARSLALVVDDPDAPGGTFGAVARAVPSARPRPAPVRLCLVALDSTLDELPARAAARDVDEAVSGHVLAAAELVGTLERRPVHGGLRAVPGVRFGIGTEEAAMATRGSTTRDSTKGSGAALDRLGGSLDAAQEALKDLRRELSKGGRDLLKDLEVLLRDARKNLRGTQRTLVKDLEAMQKAAAGKPRTAAKRAPVKRSAAAKRTGAAAKRKPSSQQTRAARNT